MLTCLLDLGSEVWKSHKPALQQFLADFSLDASVAVALHTVLHKPFRDQLQQYTLILSKLKGAAGQVPDLQEIPGGFGGGD